jgi:hypothetical protein
MTGRHTVNTITSDALDQLYADLDQARQHASAIAAQRDRLRQRMNTLADRWDHALAPDKPYARTLREEISCAPFDPEGAMTVQEYTERGRRLWAFRCWGTDTCDGWLGLEHPTQTSALAERERHVAEAHVETGPPQPGHPTRSRARSTKEAAMTDPSRYDQLSPLARALVDDYDEIDLAEMLVKTQDDLAAHRAAITSPSGEVMLGLLGALHQRAYDGTCSHCTGMYAVPYPCPTIQVLDQPTPAPAATGTHVYLSTGCLHGDHGYCQGMTGLAGAKRPGECKHCGTKCICNCHTTPAPAAAEATDTQEQP